MKSLAFVFMLALSLSIRTAAQELSGLDQLLIFNPNTDIRNGETSEFTKLSEINNRFQAVKNSTFMIGLGEAFPLTNGDRTAHEMFVLGQVGQVSARISDPVTGAAKTFSEDTPMTFSVFSVFDPKDRIELIYDDPKQAGKVLWNFHTDETVRGLLGIKKGFHNSYSNTDGGATENLFNAARDAQTRGVLNEGTWRSRLTKFIPQLAQNEIWKNFSQSSPKTELETNWLSIMRQKGWTAVAVVINGNFLDLNHFRVTEIKKLNPNEGGALSKPKNYVLENNSDRSDWTIAGFILDPKIADFKKWQEAMEAFGQGVHFHGIRSDGQKMGHVLTAVLSEKPVQVSIFPLQLVQSDSAGVFNNDISVTITKVGTDQKTFEITVDNSGKNFVRNLEIALLEGTGKTQTAITTVPSVKPGEKLKITMTSKKPLDSGHPICTIVDSNGKIIEGGLMKTNNTACLK